MPELANANAQAVVDRLRGWNADCVSQVVEHRGETTIVVPHKLLLATARQCKEDPQLNFNQISDVTCVDRFPAEPRFELNYQLLSIPRLARLRLRTTVSGQGQPVADSRGIRLAGRQLDGARNFRSFRRAVCREHGSAANFAAR